MKVTRTTVELPGVTPHKLDAAVWFYNLASWKEFMAEAIVEGLQVHMGRMMRDSFCGDELPPEPTSLRNPNLRDSWPHFLDPEIEIGDPLKLSVVTGPAGLNVFEDLYELGQVEAFIRASVSDALEIALKEAIIDADGKCIGWNPPGTRETTGQESPDRKG